MNKRSQPKGGKPMRHAVLTKKAMQKKILFCTSTQVAELLRVAAEQKEISKSDFIRQAITEKVARELSALILLQQRAPKDAIV